MWVSFRFAIFFREKAWTHCTNEHLLHRKKIQKIINGILNGNLLIPLKITINGKVGQLTLMFILGKITLMFFVNSINGWNEITINGNSYVDHVKYLDETWMETKTHWCVFCFSHSCQFNLSHLWEISEFHYVNVLISNMGRNNNPFWTSAFYDTG